MRCVSARVFPLPAPATMSTGPSVCSTASDWMSLRPSSKGDTAFTQSSVGGMGDAEPERRYRWPDERGTVRTHDETGWLARAGALVRHGLPHGRRRLRGLHRLVAVGHGPAHRRGAGPPAHRVP